MEKIINQIFKEKFGKKILSFEPLQSTEKKVWLVKTKNDRKIVILYKQKKHLLSHFLIKKQLLSYGISTPPIIKIGTISAPKVKNTFYIIESWGEI
jgi:hypothetical protein